MKIYSLSTSLTGFLTIFSRYSSIIILKGSTIVMVRGSSIVTNRIFSFCTPLWMRWSTNWYISVVFPTRRGPMIAVIRSLLSRFTSSANSSLQSGCRKTRGTAPVLHHSFTSCRYRMGSIGIVIIVRSYMGFYCIRQNDGILSNGIDIWLVVIWIGCCHLYIRDDSFSVYAMYCIVI